MSELIGRRECGAAENIGIFVDATPEGEKRIDYAATLAHQYGGHLAGIHVVSAVRPEYRSDYYVIGEKAIQASLAERRTADETATSNVRRRFEAIQRSAILVPSSG